MLRLTRQDRRLEIFQMKKQIACEMRATDRVSDAVAIRLTEQAKQGAVTTLAGRDALILVNDAKDRQQTIQASLAVTPIYVRLSHVGEAVRQGQGAAKLRAAEEMRQEKRVCVAAVVCIISQANAAAIEHMRDLQLQRMKEQCEKASSLRKQAISAADEKKKNARESIVASKRLERLSYLEEQRAARQRVERTFC